MDVRDRRAEEGLRADRGPAGQLRGERRRLRRPRQPNPPLALRLPVLTLFSAVTIPDFSGISLRTFPAFNSGLFRRKASHAAFAEAAELVLTQRPQSAQRPAKRRGSRDGKKAGRKPMRGLFHPQSAPVPPEEAQGWN